MNQKNNLPERNKKVAICRWKKEELMYNHHISKISKTSAYKIFKSRLMGFLAGDGTISIRTERKRPKAEHHDIAFYPDHFSMINPFVEAFSFLYIKKPKVSSRKNFYSIKVSSKSACSDLMKSSKFGIYTWSVPFDFLCSRKSKAEWLRAFFDCEAYVGKREIRVQSVNKKGLMEVKKLLEDFEIEARTYEYNRKNDKWNTNYILNIGPEQSRRTFLNMIGFNHALKHKKLENQLNARMPESG